MRDRKNICLLTAFPEGTHQERIISGVLKQCECYGYNVTVLSTTIHLHTQRQRYLLGEINIYSLLNPDMVDGIILDTAPLTGDNSGNVFREVTDSILSYCKKPIVSIEMPWDHYRVIANENEEILREAVRHAVNVHGKRKLCFLTGYDSEPISHMRLNVFLDEARKLGVFVPDEYIIYGDFWYTSGEVLAKRFADGELELPEAVICASDHMALGLLSGLIRNGFRVPEDVIVLGFEACPEALCNDIPLSTYEANDIRTACDAVNYLRTVIEPGEPIIPVKLPPQKLFHPGKTCGCNSDFLACAHAFKTALYLPQSHNAESYRNVNIGLLMESYISEDLTAARTPDECLFTILANAYLVSPFENVYLCLSPKWLEMHDDITAGYPDQMKTVMRCSVESELSFASEQGYLFDTKCLLPQLAEHTEEPHVFYFSPMHFNEHTLGYAVLERRLSEPVTMNLVYKNWLRFVNNALEMTRAKYKLMHMSVRDEMTGAYNRRGLYLRLDEMLKNAAPDSRFFCAVIDMDGLKAINDTYGHNEGDFGIRKVAEAASAVTRHHEICVRAGGDEFYIVGVGQYGENAAAERTEAFQKQMAESTEHVKKPYQITASIGCITCEVGRRFNADEAIHRADEIMYAYKVQHKLQRMQ